MSIRTKKGFLLPRGWNVDTREWVSATSKLYYWKLIKWFSYPPLLFSYRLLTLKAFTEESKVARLRASLLMLFSWCLNVIILRKLFNCFKLNKGRKAWTCFQRLFGFVVKGGDFMSLNFEESFFCFPVPTLHINWVWEKSWDPRNLWGTLTGNFRSIFSPFFINH